MENFPIFESSIEIELKISTSIELDGKLTPLEILTNLTNSVQTPDSIELSMIIIKLELP